MRKSNASLARRILNDPRMIALCVPEELAEVKAVISANVSKDAVSRVTLRRTFNQKWPDGSIERYWRVTGPVGHPNANSDLSAAGLKAWGIIQ